MKDVRLSDYGSTFEITLTEDGVAVDVSAATTKQIKFKKPNGLTVTKTALFTTDGTDGKIDYVIETGVIDQVGPWEIQGLVSDGATFQYSSVPDTFTVGKLVAA